MPLEQNEFDALVAWTFNLGPSKLNSSTMLKVLNETKRDEVPVMKCVGGIKLVNGETLVLIRRREAESGFTFKTNNGTKFNICNTTPRRFKSLELGGLSSLPNFPSSIMNEVSFKDFDILSEQDKAEAVALLQRYDQLEKQDGCQSDFISL